MVGRGFRKPDDSPCNVCGCELTDETWSPSMRKYRRFCCRTCWTARQKKYTESDPDWREKKLAKAKIYRDNMPPDKKSYQDRKRKCRFISGKFGITLKEYEAMVEERRNCCDICGTDNPKGNGGSLHIDHCHLTGRVRGLLCMNCNVVLGLMYDNSKTLEAAAKYIKMNKTREDHSIAARKAGGGKKC